MEHHVLKIAPEYFDAVLSGKKLFEIRYNDRDFQEGDTVDLCEHIIDVSMYTGRILTRKIGYVCDFAQQPGYVVFSLISE